MANGSVSVGSTVRMVVKTDKNNLTTSLATQGGPVAWYLRKIASLFDAFVTGAWNCNVKVTVTCVAATGTISPSSQVNTDTITVGGVTLTGTTNTQDATHYKVGASDAACATNMATCINANTTTNKLVSASASSGVVTLTALVPGVIGNQITLAISAHGTVSGANLSGGSEGSTSTYAKGL